MLKGYLHFLSNWLHLTIITASWSSNGFWRIWLNLNELKFNLWISIVSLYQMWVHQSGFTSTKELIPSWQYQLYLKSSVLTLPNNKLSSRSIAKLRISVERSSDRLDSARLRISKLFHFNLPFQELRAPHAKLCRRIHLKQHDDGKYLSLVD
jgi:hypothetical protein